MTTVSFCILGRIERGLWSEQHWLAAVRGLGASVQGAAVCGFAHLQFYQNSPLFFCRWLERVIVAQVITESLWVRMGAGSKPSNCVLVLERWALRPCWICTWLTNSCWYSLCVKPCTSHGAQGSSQDTGWALALLLQCCCYWHCSGI